MTNDDTAPPGQLTEAEIKALTPDEIVSAQKAGKLNHYLGAPLPPPTEGQITEEQLSKMSPEEIVKAQNEGRLAALLGRI